MTIVQIPSKFDAAIKHAVATSNKRLLNRLELELIRIFNISPLNEGGFPYANYYPIAIADDGERLIVEWDSKFSGECKECEGSGELQAIGVKKRYTVECPACDGEGHTDCLPNGYTSDDFLFSDVDGNYVDIDSYGYLNFDSFNHECPLKKYNEDQNNPKSKVAL